MTLHWSSFGDFLAMGGYGLYVWGSFGMVVLVIAAELMALRARRMSLARLADEESDTTADIPLET